MSRIINIATKRSSKTRSFKSESSIFVQRLTEAGSMEVVKKNFEYRSDKTRKE